jgi:hypothetical protein
MCGPSNPGGKMPLSKLSILNAKYQTDPSTGEAVYHVADPHALTQAAGYLKYVYGTKKQAVYFRGHTRLYGQLRPSLFRKISSVKAQNSREKELRDYIGDMSKNSPLLRTIYAEAREPLLQHYGLDTSWVDLVDNLWIALWFACHKAHITGRLSEYLHYERRIPNLPGKEYTYISLVAADFAAIDSKRPGFYSGTKTELVDLRVATPSVFVRPHAQHGLLFRLRGDKVRRPLDYNSQVRGIIRVDLASALAWLGDGHSLSAHALFPPAYYDHGYRILLSCGMPASKFVGAIQHVGV